VSQGGGGGDSLDHNNSVQLIHGGLQEAMGDGIHNPQLHLILRDLQSLGDGVIGQGIARGGGSRGEVAEDQELQGVEEMLRGHLVSGEEGSLLGMGAEGSEASDVSGDEEAEELDEREEGGVCHGELGQGSVERPSVREGDGGGLDGAEDGLCGEGDGLWGEGL
jgi:hypothetical protein